MQLRRLPDAEIVERGLTLMQGLRMWENVPPAIVNSARLDMSKRVWCVCRNIPGSVLLNAHPENLTGVHAIVDGAVGGIILPDFFERPAVKADAARQIKVEAEAREACAKLREQGRRLPEELLAQARSRYWRTCARLLGVRNPNADMTEEEFLDLRRAAIVMDVELPDEALWMMTFSDLKATPAAPQQPYDVRDVASIVMAQAKVGIAMIGTKAA